MNDQPAETEEGPDPNDLRRHAKKMLTEFEYRKKYRRIDFYRPNRKQLLFHNTIAREKALRAGNQLGKTQAAGAQMTFDAIAYYPGWYEGRRFLERPKIERAEDFLGWAACTTQGKTRDGAQIKLLGDIRTEKGLGTGLIPLDNIVGRPTMARGISDFVDTVRLRRETGGNALIRFKTYEMDREAFQGEAVDVIWLDEDISRFDDTVYGECVARLVTTRGQIMCSLSPLLGMSPLRKRFKERAGSGECVDIVMTIDDAAVSAGGHVPDEDIPAIVAGYKVIRTGDPRLRRRYAGRRARVRDTRRGDKACPHPIGLPDLLALALGRRLPTLRRRHRRTSVRRRAGRSRPRQRRYLYRACASVAWPRTRSMLPPCEQTQCEVRRWLGRMTAGAAPASSPEKPSPPPTRSSGSTCGPTHATFADGGYNFEAGIAEMEIRFATGRLKIAAHLTEVFDEYQNYHRVDGLVHKVDDDLMSAIRMLCMDIRFAKPAEGVRRDHAPRRPAHGPECGFRPLCSVGMTVRCEAPVDVWLIHRAHSSTTGVLHAAVSCVDYTDRRCRRRNPAATAWHLGTRRPKTNLADRRMESRNGRVPNAHATDPATSTRDLGTGRSPSDASDRWMEPRYRNLADTSWRWWTTSARYLGPR